MRIPDRTLRRWLRSGRPQRVERQLDNPEIVDRLEGMTALSDSDREALDELTSAQPGAIERVATAVDERINDG